MNQDLHQHLEDIVKAPQATPQNIEEQLRALALQLKAQGMTQRDMLNAFHDYRNAILGIEPNETTDAFDNVLDYICGWCSPHMKIFETDLKT